MNIPDDKLMVILYALRVGHGAVGLAFGGEAHRGAREHMRGVCRKAYETIREAAPAVVERMDELFGPNLDNVIIP